jgi:hypothetical protein
LRAYERERRGTAQVSWLLAKPEAEEFRTWWEDDLIQGAAWFLATWPSPNGLVPMQYAFNEPPNWEHQGNGIWRVAASLEYRPYIAPPAP